MAAWATSGLSCKDYAAKAGINPRTLTWWKSKLRSAGEVAAAAAASFVEVTGHVAEAVPATGVLELVVGGAMIRVHGRVEPDALARVLDVLEARR